MGSGVKKKDGSMKRLFIVVVFYQGGKPEVAVLQVAHDQVCSLYKRLIKS